MMSALWSVIQYEYQKHVLKKSFLITLVSVPLLVAVVVGASFVGRILRDDSPVAVGYVDRSGVLSDPLVPADDAGEPSVRLLPFPTEEAARTALETAEIAAYYVLAADYSQTRQVELVYREEPDGDAIGAFQDLLRIHLLTGQPPEVARRALAGGRVIVRLPEDEREFSGTPTAGEFLPAVGGFAFVFLILFSSGYLMQAVAEEKANRTIEILLTSISSGQLVTGKVLGILAVTLTLLVAWGALVLPIVFAGGQILGLEWLCNLHVDPTALVILPALLIPFYALVAALMIAIGAALDEARIGQQITAILILLYVTPLPFILPILNNLNGSLAAGLSLFPLTAPLFLPLRIVFAQVPTWQIVAGVALQSLCAAGGIWLAGRAVRLGMLRYGQRLKWGELLGRSAAQSGPPRAGRSGRALPVYEVAGKRRTHNKTWLVLRYELVTAVTRPMFLLLCAGFPLLLFGQMALFQVSFPGSDLSGGAPGAGAATAEMPQAAVSTAVGYVDRSGLVRTLPENIPPGTLVPYADEAGAHRALEAGDVASYYVIPADYLETGELIAVRPAYNPLATDSSGWMDWVLLVNLLGGDVELAARVWNPMALRPTPLADTAAPGETDSANPYLALEGNIFLRTIPMLVTLLVYGIVLLASGMLITSVSDEKKNRTMEVMLLSVAPHQMLAGKITALGIAGLIQAVVWGGMGLLLFTSTGWASQLPPGVEIPPAVLFWGVVYSVLGYAAYATLMAGAGALIPDLKKSPLVTLFFSVPALVGFEISLISMENPHSVLSTAASLFPLTAPFSMINRLVVGGVPLWQVLLSVALLLVTIPLLVRVIARMFHAQNLLAGQPFTVRRYFQALRGR